MSESDVTSRFFQSPSDNPLWVRFPPVISSDPEVPYPRVIIRTVPVSHQTLSTTLHIGTFFLCYYLLSCVVDPGVSRYEGNHPLYSPCNTTRSVTDLSCYGVVILGFCVEVRYKSGLHLSTVGDEISDCIWNGSYPINTYLGLYPVLPNGYRRSIISNSMVHSCTFRNRFHPNFTRRSYLHQSLILPRFWC